MTDGKNGLGLEEILSAVAKKARGYQADEVIEEYNISEGETVLVKKRVTTKHVPPDTAAAKLILENKNQYQDLTDEQLDAEKQRLLTQLKKLNIENKE